MIKAIKIILTVLVTSLYFFPFYSPLLPTNTKNLVALIGFLLALFELMRERGGIPRQLLILMMISGMVSIMSMVSITYNQTPDTTYATFIRSTAIWLSGAFTIAYLIRIIHGRVDVPLVVHYLIGVCVFQCTMALLIEFIPSVRAFVDRYVWQAQDFLQYNHRLYGIGAMLDVAGSRFAAVLVAIAFLLFTSPERISAGKAVFYTLSYTIITIVGCMIARTTIIGSLIGLTWMLIGPFLLPRKYRTSPTPTLGKGIAIIGTLVVCISISTLLYNRFPEAKTLFRFGFEGFFSWVETGSFETSSTNKLETMIVWPDNLRTWIIGDGYFENSRNDPNYLGNSTDDGFYMGTDIGYLRFIFYFGLCGLVWIIALIVYSAYVCATHFKSYSWLFVMALLVGLAVWAKVSTDIFLYFALFLCAAALNDSPEETTETVSREPEALQTP